MKRKYLGFTFLKNGGEWEARPTKEKKKKLKEKLSEYLKRGKAIAICTYGSMGGLEYYFPSTPFP